MTTIFFWHALPWSTPDIFLCDPFKTPSDTEVNPDWIRPWLIRIQPLRIPFVKIVKLIQKTTALPFQPSSRMIFFLRSWWLQDSSSDSSVNIGVARCFGRNHGSALNLEKTVVQKQLESPVLVGLQTDTPDTIEIYRNLLRSWVAAGHLVFDIRQNSFVLPWFLRPCCLFGIWTCIDIDGGRVLLTGDGASVGWLRKRHTEVRGVEELLNRVSDNAVRDSSRLKMNTSKLNHQRTPFMGCYRGCGSKL